MNAHPDIVAIGTSSGGIEALQSLLAALCDLDAIGLVVLHRPANRDQLFARDPGAKVAGGRRRLGNDPLPRWRSRLGPADGPLFDLAQCAAFEPV